MKFEKLILFAFTLFFVLMNGCVTTRETQETANSEKKSDKTENPSAVKSAESIQPLSRLPENEKIKIAEGVLERIIKGINEENYELYTADYFDDLRKKVPQKGFKPFLEKLKEELGDFKSKIYIGILNKPLFDVFIWKAKFSRRENDDVLIRLLLVEDKESGQCKVYGFYIRPF